MSARRRRKHERKLPVMLEYLIESLEEQHPAERPGVANALRAFGYLATRELPGRGAFAGDQPELYQAIEQIADQHLGFGTPRRAFFAATRLVTDSELRDRIESNANHMRRFQIRRTSTRVLRSA